jgi:uncharacterized protein (DUF1800 family)
MAATDILGTTDAAHLLRRAGFGATAKDLAHFAPLTRAAAAAELVNVTPRRSKPPSSTKNGTAALASMQRWWLKQMLAPKTRLHEKLALFWSGHFATAWSLVPDSVRLARQNMLFRSLGVGSFRTLLYEVGRDGAMLLFRGGASNEQPRANEGYAMALLGQYALGSTDAAGGANFTQTDVSEYARALTGYRLGPKDVFGKVEADAFDSGSKHVFAGRTVETTGNLGVEDALGVQLPAATNVLDLLFAHRDSDARPTLARFVTRKLFEFFAYPGPDLAVVDELADAFVASGYQTGALVQALLAHDAFFSDAARTSTVKNPVELVLSSLNALGAKTSFATVPDALSDMGMALFDPPLVDGWNAGTDWLGAGLVLARLDFAQALAAGRSGKTYTLSPAKLFPSKVTDEALLVDGLLAALDVTPSATARLVLIDYLAGAVGLVPKDRIERKLRGVVALALSLPEYQRH